MSPITVHEFHMGVGRFKSGTMIFFWLFLRFGIPGSNWLLFRSNAAFMKTNEIDEIKMGRPFPAWKFIPWILDVLGHELTKKPPPPELTEE